MHEATDTKSAMLSNRAYDLIRWFAQYGLPGLGTLYFTIAAIWGLDYGEQVLGTITALTIFLGVVMGISKSSYKANERYDGTLTVGAYEADKLNVDRTLDELMTMDEIKIAVKRPTDE